MKKRKSKPRPTLSQVARLAGVAPVTVSRSLNTPHLVTEETNRRIGDAVRRTGYARNLLAAGLASQRSGLVAVIVPALNNTIFSEVIEAMTAALMRAHYQVMLSISGFESNKVAACIDSVLARRPEGVILTGAVTDRKLRAKLAKADATIIEAFCHPERAIDCSVGFSHLEIGAAIARLFHELGRRKPLVMSPTTASSDERLLGFTQTMQALGVHQVNTLTLPIPATFNQGRQALAQFIDGGGSADCIMCGSDWQAHGVLTEAGVRGIVVPDDLAVIGLGDMDFSDGTTPGLTSVHIDGPELGRAVAKIFVDRSAGIKHEPTSTDIGFSIVRRGSA